jgi:hypothetical protein
VEGDESLEERVPARLSPAEGRRFGLLVGGALLVLAGVLWWRGRLSVASTAGGLGVLLVAAGLIIPGRLGPVHRAWMAFGLALSKVTTPVFMGLVYFLVFTPTGALMRLFGRNPIAPNRRQATFWVARTTGPRSDMERQF